MYLDFNKKNKKTFNKNFKILDCTLRDGSYVVNFSFTASDTKNIAKALDNLGLDFIEVGHGVGLGASNNKFTKASASDEEYMEAASEAVKKK